MLLNNQQITEEIKKDELKICIETNDNENKTTQNNKVNGTGIVLINNYLKCKWVESPNQKIKTG